MDVNITYFVHGTTTDNIDKLSTGWLPGVLSEKGIKQSIELIDQIDIDKFDIVFCSDLKRSIDSARLTFQDKKEIVIDKRIRECNYGDLNGKESALVKYEEHIDIAFPNGESLIDVENRIREFLEYLKQNYENKNIAMVCHRAPQLAMEVIINNKTWEQSINSDWRKTKDWKAGWEYHYN